MPNFPLSYHVGTVLKRRDYKSDKCFLYKTVIPVYLTS